MPEPVDLLATLEFRDAVSGDTPFLFSLYCDVRTPELDAWGWPAAQREPFLRMQFEAQRRSYEAAYPEATHEIVCSGGVEVGRRLVAHTPAGMHLVDIALLTAHRNRGIGTRLIQQMLDECAASNCPLALSVLQGNPALRLYQRLGFHQTSADPMYIQMAWLPETVHST
jgi:ribosomal protein S18 acetylase RimI-like enzyme